MPAFIAILWILFAVPLGAPAATFAQSEPKGAVNPGDLHSQVDAVFAAYDKPGSPGCALGVIKDGQLVYARGYGMANLEHGIPISSKTVFDIGSTSKQFTTGLYRNPVTGALRRILLQEGKLRIDQFGPSFELAPLAADRFHLVGQPIAVEITFESARPGAVRQFRLAREASKPEVFEAVPAVSPTPAQLAEYTGRYFSEELDTTYTLVLDGDKLSLQRKNTPPSLLQPAFRNAFVFQGIQLEFSRDDQGRVVGFGVDAGRIRNVRFVKQSETQSSQQ